MKNNGYCEEPILQSEKFNMSIGSIVRIQVKESSYVITFKIDTDMYKDLRMNTFKKGLRISSTLKKNPRHKITKNFLITKKINDISQLTEDTITFEDKYYAMKIVVRLSDFLRSDVRKTCEKRFLNEEYNYFVPALE